MMLGFNTLLIRSWGDIFSSYNIVKIHKDIIWDLHVFKAFQMNKW